MLVGRCTGRSPTEPPHVTDDRHRCGQARHAAHLRPSPHDTIVRAALQQEGRRARAVWCLGPSLS